MKQNAELQELLQLAHEENRGLREQVEQQAEEIALLEGNVLGALRDIRDDETTGRRWASSGAASRRPQQRSSSQPSKAHASSVSPGPGGGRITPPRKPGDIRRVMPPKDNDRNTSFVKIPSTG